MKLYVCYGTFSGGQGHPCGVAHDALKDAGYQPQVVKAYGHRFLPDFLNFTSGRREVKELTGSTTVPVLVTDDGEVVREGKGIKRWAKAHPAG